MRHRMRWNGNLSLSRRDLFRSSGVAAFMGWLPETTAAATEASEPTSDVYTRLGVRPFINGTATLTINGGSRLLPEVIEAVAQASHYHVHLDELMEAAGKRVAELLEVEWALITSGSAAALTHATAACVAGTDPERIQQLPDVTGLKDEVIVPKSSQSTYFQAIRTAGIKMVEVETLEELEASIGEHTAMVAVLGNRFDNVALSLEAIAPIAKRAGVPVLVDAAADYLVVPNPYLAQGADMVAYSCGKILRGPQTAGLLLGREDLVRAASANAAPHHALGRPMKVSKEEIVGAVTAVALWIEERDLEAEYEEWKGWYDYVSAAITRVDGVTTTVRPPSRGGPFPTLWIEWDPVAIPMTAGELHELLMDGTPRIATHAAGGGHGFLLRPVALKPEEYRIVAERLEQEFREASTRKPPPPLTPPAADVSGRWEVDVYFALGRAKHLLFLEARGNDLRGTHLGSRARGELEGHVDGRTVRFRSVLPYEGSRLRYAFEGTVTGDRMTGELDLGEYPSARWTATRVV